jgi:hypothetical protein
VDLEQYGFWEKDVELGALVAELFVALSTESAPIAKPDAEHKSTSGIYVFYGI